MLRTVVVAMFAFGVSAGVAGAQGMYPLNPSVTVNQQRTNPYTVSPNAPTQTYPSGNTFASPFVSPFTTAGASYPARSGYAGSGAR